VPVLIIGSHELRGTIEPLAQPFCVLEKQIAAAVTTRRGDVENDDENDDDINNDASSSCFYQVRGIIDRKLLFRQYPKTLIR
jgi:Ctf8